MGAAATITAVAEAVKAVFAFLATEQGQATVKSWRESSEAWNHAIEGAGQWLAARFR